MLQTGVWIGLHLHVLFGGSHRQEDTELFFFATASAVAYALAFVLNLEIAREYRDNVWMRWSWLLLAGNAGLSIGREIVESPLLNSVLIGYAGSPLARVHHQMVIGLANSCLILGLAGMWWAYQRVRLGFRIGRREYAQIGVIVVITLALLISRKGMSEGASPYLASRLLQPLGLVLLSFAAAISVVLHGMAVQMGGGKLAVALRCLTLYTLVRATLVLVEALLSLTSPERRQTHDLTMFLDLLCWRTVPWILVLAAAYRAELTVHARKALDRQRAGKAALATA